MRAASQPVSFSLGSVSSARFLRHVRPTGLAVVSLLFIVALTLVPKVDVLETPFDEGNTPINEIVVENTASLCDPQQAATASAPKKLAQPQRVGLHRVLPVYAKLLTDSRTRRELFCFFLC